MKKFVLFLSAAFIALSASACGGEGTAEENPGGNATEETAPVPADSAKEDMITPVAFENLSEAEDLSRFISEVDEPDGSHDNGAKTVGAVISPYYTLSAEGKELPCYAVRTAYGAHSFACADVESAAFPVTVEAGFSEEIKTAVVLPESRGVKLYKNGGRYYMKIGGCGDYTIVPNGDKTKAITLLLREKQDFSAPSGYDVVKISAGYHEEKITFGKSKRVLYFAAGEHRLKYCVDFLSDTAVYLENGAYIYAEMPDGKEDATMDTDWAGMPRWKALFNGEGVKNAKIYGRGTIDLSRLDWHARSAIRFDLSENVSVEGVTLNNAPEWTAYFTRCKGVSVSSVLLFGYRQNSDGICMVDSADCRTENCFARSGDDLFEVKSMYGDCDIPIKNIVFENCSAWPDKARGLGIISESKRDMTDIKFRNCSVGYASAEWMDALGGLVVILADGARVSDVAFDGAEIYHSAKYPVNVTLQGGSTAVIEGLLFKDVNISGSEPVRVLNETSSGEIKGITFENCRRGGALINNYAALGLSLSGVSRNIVTIK